MKEFIISIMKPIKEASFARNLGLQKSKGKYISYLDSDNTYTSSFMSHAIEFLEKNQNFDLVYGLY